VILENTTGENHRNARLDDDKVRDIRKRAAEGERYRVLAQEYGITESYIGLIVRRINWKHVD